MARSLRSELRKVVTTRSTWGILFALVTFVVVSVLQTQTTADAAKPIWERQFYSLATMHTRLFLLILGIKLATDDFRFGTIVSTILVTPKRNRVAAAKVAAASGIGLLGAVVAATAMIVAAAGNLGGLDAREVASLAGFVAGGALWATIGTGVGLVVRHQLGAVVGGIVWVTVVEQLLMRRGDILGSYLPGAAGGAFGIGESTGSMVVGGLVLLAYAAAFSFAGSAALARRDIP